MNRPTPETDALDQEPHNHRLLQNRYIEIREHAQNMERERDEAMELLASEKITRNHIIKRSVEVEKERDEAREALREIRAADWKTSGELRGMARKALEAVK